MAEWAFVENNEIIEVYDIVPTSWRNISGLIHSVGDLPFMKSLGWYPITKQHQDFDPEKEQFKKFTYKFENEQVIESLVLEPVEVEDPAVVHERNMHALRTKRNKLLSESDHLLLPDFQEVTTDEMKSLIKDYRQALRDITTTQPYHPSKVNWPPRPDIRIT